MENKQYVFGSIWTILKFKLNRVYLWIVDYYILCQHFRRSLTSATSVFYVTLTLTTSTSTTTKIQPTHEHVACVNIPYNQTQIPPLKFNWLCINIHYCSKWKNDNNKTCQLRQFRYHKFTNTESIFQTRCKIYFVNVKAAKFMLDF